MIVGAVIGVLIWSAGSFEAELALGGLAGIVISLISRNKPGQPGLDTATVGLCGARRGPYRLAYGHHAAPAAAFPIASLIPGYSTEKAFPVKPTTLGEPVTLGGAHRLRAPVDCKRWALWIILVLGVAALALMAYRLVRQMRHGEPRSDKAPRDGQA